MRKFFWVLVILGGLVLLIGCAVEGERSWQSVPNLDAKYQLFELHGHAYIRFCDGRYLAGSGATGNPVIVHDPDCKKCVGQKENLQGLVPLERESMP